MPGASFLPSHPWPHSPWNWAPFASWINLSILWDIACKCSWNAPKTWYITICLCSKKVFKLFDTLYVQCCLPLVVSPGWWHNSSPKKNMIQYFTANVLLYKLDVWCSLFVVSPQHWAWWFIMKLCLAAGLSKCVLYIIELLFEWLVMLFHVISDIPFFDVWCRK